MHPAEIIVGLLAAVAVLVTASRRLGLSYPIVLVLGGLALGFVPGLPRVSLPPDLVLVAFLPPLLYAESITFSWRDLLHNARPICLLAFGLVLGTMAAVAAVAHAVVPQLPWAAAFALGAIVAPTDPVAAAAIAKRLGLPRQILVILTGESLINDATALVAYRLAVVAAVSGVFSPAQAAGQFVLSSLGGVAIGLAVGFVLAQVRQRMQPDPPVENTISLLSPFAAYLPAETLHVSGVLAVVTLGLYLGRQGSRFLSATTRLQGSALWSMIDFLLNGLLFILVGLQLRPILDGIAGHHPGRLIAQGAEISLAVILARLVWVFTSVYLPRILFPRHSAEDPYPSWRPIMVVAWTGMRGGISLAAALALPLTVAGGQPFPGRELLLFLTFAVILSTLVVQGLSLPLLISRLALPKDETASLEVAQTRRRVAQSALDYLGTVTAQSSGLPQKILDSQQEYWTRKTSQFAAREQGQPEEESEAKTLAFRRLRRGLIDTQRDTAIKLRDDGTISDTVLQAAQRALDLEEQRLIMEEEDPD